MISTTAELEELIDGTVSIPTIPTILNEIHAVFTAVDGSARDAARVIGKDPAIAAKVLRLVNSSFYGLKTAISSIDLACSILGLKVIRNLVVQATVLETFGQGPALAGFSVDWLWDHSFKVAVAARLLATRTDAGRGLAPDDAYTCGLIHDIGKMILLDNRGEQFGEALRLSRESGVPLATAEHDVFGFHHAHVGGLLARRWKLPEAVQTAVLHHHGHATSAEDQAHGFLIKAANTLAHQAADGDGGYRGDLCDGDAMLALGLGADELAEITELVRLTAAAV